MRKPEDYESEIQALKAELERLRGGAAAMTMAGARQLAPGSPVFSLAGLEESILLVGEKGEISYLNDRMARLLGLDPEARKALLGRPFAELPRGPAVEVVGTLLLAARESGSSFVVERELPELQGATPEWEKHVPLLRFACSLDRGKVQIVVQDLTHSRWLEKNFSRYVSTHVIDQMREVSEEELQRTQRREATVLFGDLRGFTRACQELAPEQVVAMVNSFMAVAVAGVERYDGMVDKFVGDEIMAVFGVPLPMADHALRALMAADQILKGHAIWQEERRAAGLVAPAVGLGLATGEIIVGNIGTPQRLDYTVLGHNVNLAARLCAKAGPGEILTVRETHQAARAALPLYRGPDPVPHFHFEPKGMIELKNIFKPVEIVAVSTKEPADL